MIIVRIYLFLLIIFILVLSKGDTADSMYIIIKGEVGIYIDSDL